MIRQNFNQNWQFIKGGNNSIMAAFLGKETKQYVNLPHDAMILEERTPDTKNGAQTGFYPGGEYIYIKEIDLPDEWKEKKVILEFEGIYQTAQVYVNGALAAQNKYGYSNFYVTVNKWLKFGEVNQIKVYADNSKEPNSRWYTGSGIYRDVKLMIGERIHIKEDGVRITTRSANQNSAIIEIESKICSISRECERILQTVIISKDGMPIAEDKQMIVMYSNSEELARHSICIPSPCLWDCENPNLYECTVRLQRENETLDEAVEQFGIRTLTVDAVNGLCINGKEVKLRGACIHHDNGILGAATLKGAEERRCKQLKSAGFNSIRSSHHPISKAMLNACDKYGVLVMDELCDMWTVRKNPYDFALDFETCWEESVTQMVAKDYNHPSVILYSSGNEISEAGSDAGSRINRHICNKFRELDTTRFTTNGLNGLMAAGYRLKDIMTDVMQEFEKPKAAESGNQDGSNVFNSFMSLMEGEKGEYFAKHPLLTEALEGCSSSCDIIGLNYLTGRHLLEKELHPNKAVIGTETYPADIVRLWNIVKQNPHMLGDFTWAGYDYLGEAGCGIFHYDGSANFSSIYPERTAYIGDLDLIGYRRPISYLREIVYGLRKAPYIAVERLNRYGMKCSKTPWMFKDNIASWTWPGYEGKPAVVDVYSDAEEVELFLNGISLGKKSAGEEHNFTTTYEINYEPGELLAVSYCDNKEINRFKLITADQNVKIKAAIDRTTLLANGEDVAFITLKLVDEQGNLNLSASKEISIRVEGAGTLAAFGNADPKSVGSYQDARWKTYDGHALAVIRSGTEPGTIKVVLHADGCKEEQVKIDVIQHIESLE